MSASPSAASALALSIPRVGVDKVGLLEREAMETKRRYYVRRFNVVGILVWLIPPAFVAYVALAGWLIDRL